MIKPFHAEFEAIGTSWIINSVDSVSSDTSISLLQAIEKRITQFDKIYSRFRADSLISTMSQKRGTYTIPEEDITLFKLYDSLYKISNGTFTPLIGSVLEEAGYDASYSLQQKKLHKPLPWEDVISYTDSTVTVKKKALLDFGAGGKGYLVDSIGNIMDNYDISSYYINAGGDILYSNKKNNPLKVGLEHPANVSQVIGVANIINGSICCSAGNRRKWGQFHHIINPHTLRSPHTIISVWVTAETCFVADALATALFFVDSSVLQNHFTFDYLILFSDYSISRSEGFPAELFYKTQ